MENKFIAIIMTIDGQILSAFHLLYYFLKGCNDAWKIPWEDSIQIDKNVDKRYGGLSLKNYKKRTNAQTQTDKKKSKEIFINLIVYLFMNLLEKIFPFFL